MSQLNPYDVIRMNKGYMKINGIELAELRDLKGTHYTPDGKQEESLYISNCWINGEVTLMEMAAENDFSQESYEAGFLIENIEYTNIIDDGEDW